MKTNVREVTLSGFALINSPRLNKGTAFSDEERDAFDLHGLLSTHVGTLKEQMEKRRMQALGEQPPSTNTARHERDAVLCAFGTQH